jgi:hypothetical protein
MLHNVLPRVSDPSYTYCNPQYFRMLYSIFQNALLNFSPFQIHIPPPPLLLWATFPHCFQTLVISVMRIQVFWHKTRCPSVSVTRRPFDTSGNTKQVSQRPCPATLNLHTTAVVTSELSACPNKEKTPGFVIGKTVSVCRCEAWRSDFRGKSHYII